MSNEFNAGAQMKTPSYRPIWERVDGQHGAMGPGIRSARLVDWDQVIVQEWDDRPLTGIEAGLIKKELRSLITRRSPNFDVDENEVIRMFDRIRDAAITLELAFEQEETPIAPRHDFRTELRHLKRQPSGLNRIFEDVDDEDKQRKRSDLREMLRFGITLIDRDPDGDLRTSLQSSPQLLMDVIDALLACPLLTDQAGRQTNGLIDDYADTLKSVYRSASGREAGRSVSNNESRFDDHDVNKSGIPGGPAVRFMRLCLEPFNCKIKDGVIAELIRKPKRRAKKKKE